MFVYKCDICKKVLKDYKEQVGINTNGRLSEFLFCLSCAKPALQFLKKKV